MARSYGVVTSVICEPRQGIVFARNLGFNSAKSDIIGRIDADTALPKNWVKHIKSFYDEGNHQNSAWTGGGIPVNIRCPNFSGWALGQIVFRVNRLLLGHYIVWGANMAILSSSWKAVEHDVCLRTDIHEDLDLAIHLSRGGVEIVYQEGVKIHFTMRRVRSGRRALLQNLLLWPRTLKVHGKKTWVIGWLGAIFLFTISPIAQIAEWIALGLGRKAIKE